MVSREESLASIVRRVQKLENNAGEQATLVRRVDVSERNANDLAAQHTKMVEFVGAQDKRIKELENESFQRQIANAREDERDKNLYKRLDGIDEQLDKLKDVPNQIQSTEGRIGKIEGNGSRLLWLVVASVVVTVMGFVLGGGLKP